MPHKTFTLSIALLAFYWTNCQEFTRAGRMGSTTADAGYSITADAAGNQYITGFFSGTVDFDPGPGTVNLTSNGAEDIFILKLTAAGKLSWAKNIGGSANDYGRGIVVNYDGDVYTTGSFEGTADFDPGPGITMISSAGGSDIFICKLDTSGNFVWAKSFGANTGEDHGNAIATDASGNVYTTGSFKGSIDFDPGPGTANLTADYIDVFVNKLDPTGNLVWAKKMGGIATDIGYGIAVDAWRNVIITGHFRWTNCDYDPGPGIFYLSTYGDSDEFICKLDASGNFIWAKQFNSPAYQYSFGYSVAVDTSGNIYTTGGFHGTCDFDPGPGISNLTSAGLNDGFVSKLNSSGDFVWAKLVGGCQIDDYGYSIFVDAYGYVYSTGIFQYIADFDPGPGVFNLQSAGSTDAYISKLSSSGNFVWAKRIGSGGSDYGIGIFVDTSGNVFTTGQFEGTADFDPSPGTAYLASDGLSDAFVLQLTQAVWNGTVNNVWNHPANWNSGKVPGKTSDVVIPSGLPRYPTVFASTDIKSLILQSGATATVDSNLVLKINDQ